MSWSTNGIRIAPYINRHHHKLARIFFTHGAASPLKPDTFLGFSSCNRACTVDVVIELCLWLVTRNLHTLSTLFGKSKRIVITASELRLCVHAEVEADRSAHIISYLPVAIKISKLLKVEECRFRELVAGV